MWLKSCVVFWIVFHFESVFGESEKVDSSGVVIEKFINRHSGDHYLLSYLLSDGQFRYERGHLKTDSDESKLPIWVVSGRYGYKSPDGKLFRYKYTADDKGYRQQQLADGEEDETGAVVGNRIDAKTLASLVG